MGRFLAPFLVPCLLLGAVAPGAALAGPERATDASHRGVVSFEPYQVFPENRPNNAVYLNNRMVLSLPGETVVFVKPLAKEGRFAYLTINEFAETNLRVFLPPTDPAPRIRQVAPPLYHVVMVMDGVVYKKMYRILQGNTILDLLPTSKTADGAAVGETGVLFYHVSSVSRDAEGEDPALQFGLRIHLVLFEEERLRTLDYSVINTLPSLLLSWLDEASVQYQLADGRMETLSIAQFQ
ncbi:MAG: hypothetical protein V3S29_03070 [bacterium]